MHCNIDELLFGSGNVVRSVTVFERLKPYIQSSPQKLTHTRKAKKDIFFLCLMWTCSVLSFSEGCFLNRGPVTQGFCVKFEALMKACIAFRRQDPASAFIDYSRPLPTNLNDWEFCGLSQLPHTQASIVYGCRPKVWDNWAMRSNFRRYDVQMFLQDFRHYYIVIPNSAILGDPIRKSISAKTSILGDKT
jgi:hypothetical protein